MRLSIIVFIILTMMLQARAFEVLFMDYSDIDYSEPESYEYSDDGCSCVCEGY